MRLLVCSYLCLSMSMYTLKCFVNKEISNFSVLQEIFEVEQRGAIIAQYIETTQKTECKV